MNSLNSRLYLSIFLGTSFLFSIILSLQGCKKEDKIEQANEEEVNSLFLDSGVVWERNHFIKMYRQYDVYFDFRFNEVFKLGEMEALSVRPVIALDYGECDTLDYQEKSYYEVFGYGAVSYVTYDLNERAERTVLGNSTIHTSEDSSFKHSGWVRFSGDNVFSIYEKDGIYYEYQMLDFNCDDGVFTNYPGNYVISKECGMSNFGGLNAKVASLDWHSISLGGDTFADGISLDHISSLWEKSIANFNLDSTDWDFNYRYSRITEGNIIEGPKN
ncbi:MAG: hypothetical protein ACPGTP_06215 [Bacteroidia bacterium]